jgi:hypothetical protein
MASIEHTGRMADGVSDGEAELLIDGLSDDVALVWVLVHLGLRGNPPDTERPPTSDAIGQAFGHLDRLSGLGLIRVGRMEYVDGGAPGRISPVRHVEEPIKDVRARVQQRCDSGVDWEWSCWVVNTEAGNELARQALAHEPGTR